MVHPPQGQEAFQGPILAQRRRADGVRAVRRGLLRWMFDLVNKGPAER
jgi:hypothetical protein